MRVLVEKKASPDQSDCTIMFVPHPSKHMYSYLSCYCGINVPLCKGAPYVCQVELSTEVPTKPCTIKDKQQ
jgi:hypothetical protein